MCSALIFIPLLGGVGPPPGLRQPVLQGVHVLLPSVAVALDLSAILVEVLLRRLQLLGRRPKLLLALGQLVSNLLRSTKRGIERTNLYNIRGRETMEYIQLHLQQWQRQEEYQQQQKKRQKSSNINGNIVMNSSKKKASI